MNARTLLAAALILVSAGCQRDPDLSPEPWRDDPIPRWPTIALVNEIAIGDSTYGQVGNAFLLDTGADTLGITCKHVFLLFKDRHGLETIDPAPIRSWHMVDPARPDRRLETIRLLNADPQEPIGAFNTLKVRDWLLFEVAEVPTGIQPLRIRRTPVKKGEIVHTVGWPQERDRDDRPQVVELECFMQQGPYFYARTLTRGTRPGDTSGSPVIDAKGYLVGIVSGAEGNLGVIGSVEYLQRTLEKYGIAYAVPGN